MWLFLLLLAMTGQVRAQQLYTESFDVVGPYPQNSLALGWSQGKYGAGTDPDNYWDRVGAGTFVGAGPASVSPRTGNAMMRYRSYSTNTGEASFLVSKILDNRSKAIGSTPDTVKFWMWRDNNSGYLTNLDKIQVYVNDSAVLSAGGASAQLLTEAVTGATAINRSCTQAPTPVTCNGWNEYKFPIPTVSPYAGASASSLYIIILATSADGNNIFIDDFSVTTYPSAQTYVSNSAGVVFQNSSTTAPNQTDQLIIGCKLKMLGSTSPKVLTSMQFNTNGSTNPPNDITYMKLWYSAGTSIFDPSNAVLLGSYFHPWATNDTFLITSPWLSGSSSFNGLQHGDNYFWITYDIAPGATSGNYVDAEWISLNLTGSGTITPNPQNFAGNRLIDLVYCAPSYSVGTSWAGYQTNDFINSVTLAGDNLPPPGISNNLNLINAYAGPLCPAPFPRFCPFQSHPPDYELFAETSGKTTTVTANGTTNYPVSIQCGTYGSGNCVAAWIDYNKDGQFNNWFYQISINATGSNGSTTINLTGVGAHPGWRVGMSVSGTGIAPGATIVNSTGTSVTLSAANVGTVSGAILFSAADGEKIAQSQYLGALSTYTTTFKVPNTATSGKTRIRFREVWINYNITPCNGNTYGEVEDYVITIIPDCPGYPGYTTWLGLTDNWADPSNWCPAVAPVSPNPFVNVRIPGGPSGVYPYFRPVIRSNVIARANKLRVETGDTIYINAPSGSSLTVQDSMKIATASSAIRIKTTFLDSAQVFNGALSRPNDSPLNTANRSRSFIAFPQADLLAQGLQAGDTITNILIHIQRKSNGSPYKNLTVSYYYATNAATIFGTGYLAALPTPVGTPASPVVIYSGDVNASAYVPVSNDFGTIDLALTNRFAWSGTSNVLVIELCYDNTGFATTGTNDEVRFTQTTSLRRYMNLEALTDYPKAGCDMAPYDTAMITGTWTVGTNTITVSSLAQAANVYPGQLSYTDGRQVVSVAGTTITMNTNAFTNGTNANIILANVSNTSLFYRPNLTFKYTRPYIKYPVSVGGHWENNGLFEPAVSRVTLSGSAANQKIDGASKTTFYDLNIQNANHVMRMTDFTVMDSLLLVSGRLKLNNGMVTLLNPAPSAVVRTGGYIQAETDVLASNAYPYGRVYWKMGTTAGLHTVPFASASGISIPVDYTVKTGTHDVIIGTYNTLPNNTNLPLPEVTNIYGFDGATWGSTGNGVVDRYFLVKDSLGASPVADIVFRYLTTERAASNPTGGTSMSGQRWLTSGSLWEYPFIGGQSYAANTPTAQTDQLTVTDFGGFSGNSWWTIVGTSVPLPVSLVDFTAVPYKDKVQLRWTTASEFNSSHFIVERTLNQNDFDFIGRVESRGPGTNLLRYETWDNHPVEGTQYYYLRQHDINGKVQSYGPVSARFSRDLFEIVSAIVSPTDRGVSVVFNYNTSEPYSYKIIDMTGRVVAGRDHNAATPGANVIDIDVDLAHGAYQILLQNTEKTVSRKFFF